jgi:hypothetical protein
MSPEELAEVGESKFLRQAAREGFSRVRVTENLRLERIGQNEYIGVMKVDGLFGIGIISGLGTFDYPIPVSVFYDGSSIRWTVNGVVYTD